MISFILRKVRQHLADPAYFAEQFRRSRAVPLASGQRLAGPPPRHRDFIDRSFNNPAVVGLAFVGGLIVVVLTWHIPADGSFWVGLLAALAGYCAVYGYSLGCELLADRLRRPGLSVVLLSATLPLVLVFASFNWARPASDSLQFTSLWVFVNTVIRIAIRLK